MSDVYAADEPFTLDASAVAGQLQEIFGFEMTDVVSRCANCGNVAEIGSLRAYGLGGPGVILRCSVCREIVMRFVRRSQGGTLVDARGAAFLRFGS